MRNGTKKRRRTLLFTNAGFLDVLSGGPLHVIDNIRTEQDFQQDIKVGKSGHSVNSSVRTSHIHLSERHDRHIIIDLFMHCKSLNHRFDDSKPGIGGYSFLEEEAPGECIATSCLKEILKYLVLRGPTGKGAGSSPKHPVRE